MRSLLILSSCILIAGGAFAAPPASKTPTPAAPVVAKARTVKKPNAMPTFVRSASNSTAMIRVLVNGEPVVFDTGEPVQLDGRVLVPMREVFEALGAKVSFNDETRSIEAVRGDTIISIRPGDETATVNGEVRPLDTAIQVINGAAVVPLRFISETFGAQVAWNPNDYDVVVRTEAIVAKQLPAAPEGNSVFGALTGIYPEARLLTVRLAGGKNVRVPLVRDTNATRRTTGANGEIAVSASKGAFDAGALRLGEQVLVEFNAEYKGVLVLIDTHERRGTVKSIEELPTGGKQVTLTDGSIVALKADAAITFSGRQITLAEVKSAENVVIRLDDAGQGISLAVTTPGEKTAEKPTEPSPATAAPTTPALATP
ncbi:MAG: copper amine oxidase N-terminal domain-containing protein [Armatimonadetes bacterium]|nr:copper amine oxidase N-terminal domain-containing protein [Armatimonadota bacterium]